MGLALCHCSIDGWLGGMAKRSAAMSQACLLAAINMPAPVFDGLGHATHQFSGVGALALHCTTIGGFVPEGHLTVAQRFIAGNTASANNPSPVGTDEFRASVQSSLRDCVPVRGPHPSDKSLGYCHLPLQGRSGNADNDTRSHHG